MLVLKDEDSRDPVIFVCFKLLDFSLALNNESYRNTLYAAG